MWENFQMQVTKLFCGRLIISTKKIAWWFIKFRHENPLAANRNCLNHFTVRMITFTIARLSLFRSSRSEVFCKKGVLINSAKFTGKYLCQKLKKLRSEAFNFIKKESLTQVLSCEFCRISKNTFFTEHLRWLLLSHYGHLIVKVFSK